MRRKVLLVAILIVAMLLQCFMPFMPAYAVTSVEITLNSTLYEAVKKQLTEQGITAEYGDANGIIIISQTELEKVTKLNLSNSDIDDLTGLEAFSKVTSLNLHANKLTVDSNLQVLDSLNLTDLDLSSNQLSSIKAITKFNNIEKSDITDQRIKEKIIIKVDDSEDATTKEEKLTVSLPDILLEDCGKIKTEWLVNNLGELTREVVSFVDPATGETTNPEIDYANSFEPGTTNLVLKVARKTGENYKALRGLVKFNIKINESTSKLANTQVELNYVVVNNEENGIIFDDENMYKAVKSQLTKNDELRNTTNSRNIYSRVYDDLLIMVINENDIVNNVPSLILNNKKIKDLKGFEEFVGLDTDIDVSYNYIDSLEKIIKLERNKNSAEEKLQEKYSKILGKLSTSVERYDAECEKIKEAEKNIATQEAIISDLQREINGLRSTDPEACAAKEAEMAREEAKKADYEEEKTKAENKRYENEVKIIAYNNKLYSYYQKEYKLVSLLPKEVNYLSAESLKELTLEQARSYANAIMEKVASIEKNNFLDRHATNYKNGFTSYEEWTIRNFLTTWGNMYRFEFKTEEEDPENPGSTKKIENPISKFFEEVKSNNSSLNETAYKQFIYTFKCIDALSQIQNYTLIRRVYENKGDDYAEDAKNDILKLYDEKGYDKTFINLVTFNNSVSSSVLTRLNADGTERHVYAKRGYDINARYGSFSIDLGIGYDEYSGAISAVDAQYNELLRVGHRLALATDDVETYVILPRIQTINLADNKTRSLKGIDELSNLKELNAWKNLVNDISDVNWAAFTTMRKLNLGYNQISKINELEKLYALEDLNLSYNLLSGVFNFKLANMRRLNNADFSHNQYSDIYYLNDQYILSALGYDKDGDGRADALTVPEYLKELGINVNFRYQTLDMYTTMIENGNEFVEFELPLIFRQLEKMDDTKTTFGVDSMGDLVEPEGKTVKVRVPQVGTTGKSVVSVNGVDGYSGEEYKGEYVIDGGELKFEYIKNNDVCGMGYGTTCTIYCTVVKEPVISEEPENPGNTEEQENPGNTGDQENPGNTGDQENPGNAEDQENPGNTEEPENPNNTTEPVIPVSEYNYEVSGEYVIIYEPEITMEEFANGIVDRNKYAVYVTHNEATNKMRTSSEVTIVDKEDPTKVVTLEVVVKGDVNGDGEIDALDSGIIRNVIAAKSELVGAYEVAADVNDDGDIDSLDSMLVLQYRADRISNFAK